MTDETAQRKLERLEPEVQGRSGIPPAAPEILRRYSTDAGAAERDALVEASTR